jgi:hypothetical protein
MPYYDCSKEKLFVKIIYLKKCGHKSFSLLVLKGLLFALSVMKIYSLTDCSTERHDKKACIVFE